MGVRKALSILTGREIDANDWCSLALAEQLGADVCLNPQASATPAEVGEWLKASLPPYGPDIVIDCAGFQSTLQVKQIFSFP